MGIVSGEGGTLEMHMMSYLEDQEIVGKRVI